MAKIVLLKRISVSINMPNCNMPLTRQTTLYKDYRLNISGKEDTHTHTQCEEERKAELAIVKPELTDRGLTHIFTGFKVREGSGKVTVKVVSTVDSHVPSKVT